MKSFGSVLLVDDSSTSRMIVQRCMEMAGASVSSFLGVDNGLEALALLKKGTPIDLVVTDLNMPKMDGRAFSRIVKGDPAFCSIPVVVISSIADGDAERELKALGVASVMKKPITPAKMVDVLEALS